MQCQQGCDYENFESYGFHPFKLMISEEPRHFWPLEI